MSRDGREKGNYKYAVHGMWKEWVELRTERIKKEKFKENKKGELN